MVLQEVGVLSTVVDVVGIRTLETGRVGTLLTSISLMCARGRCEASLTLHLLDCLARLLLTMMMRSSWWGSWYGWKWTGLDW